MINKIIGIDVSKTENSDILEKIKLYISKDGGFCHIVSLNPEILVKATENGKFKKIVETAQIQIVDGVGVDLAGRWLGIELAPRIAGVDLMERLIEYASSNSLSVGLIGGGEKIAEQMADCQKLKNPELDIFGISGISNIQNPTKEEELEIQAIVAARRPHLLFVAFGSPFQEIWIDEHKDVFKHMVCMGVGGGFDFISGTTTRAPRLLRKMGLEWLYRLTNQPWRWRRQIKLIKFIQLVLWQKLGWIK